ncbi:MAG: heavy-metal-associated domain-containing protein [Cyanobacteria bacterium]|nr:heavy-metal-associated domain-containing protein [Cyanobacteria bacterium CG_2015-16_32_12]NCO78230.1 heavy-metal-associated domain-containing protein [Cyanobacteria bacterium CG_2015-22_32_23]NCQ03271.1 heavy-metal-associated domain-containing protein [Cyanobacteria bacterium CG_2015-09_32_10]NCQ41956.1 heavy-metal-associated domain-containing protein [Cyanobacteria bacterium CG_2015-04_32_10]NCS85704.1 heavy-metal-associated domain-containing protein [Cyanobacteria bacterium CG_2015-02_32_
MIITLKVPSIACEVCANTITKAMENYDPQGQISVDVSTKIVSITTNKTVHEIKKVIMEVGHTIED